MGNCQPQHACRCLRLPGEMPEDNSRISKGHPQPGSRHRTHGSCSSALLWGWGASGAGFTVMPLSAPSASEAGHPPHPAVTYPPHSQEQAESIPLRENRACKGSQKSAKKKKNIFWLFFLDGYTQTPDSKGFCQETGNKTWTLPQIAALSLSASGEDFIHLPNSCGGKGSVLSSNPQLLFKLKWAILNTVSHCVSCIQTHFV